MSRWQLLDQVNVGGVKYYVRQVAGNPKDQTARVRIKHQYALAVLVGVMLVWLLIFGAMNMSHLVRTPIYGLIIVLTVGFSVLTSPLQARVQLDIIAKFRNADVELDVVTVVDSDVEASKSKVALLEPISKSPEEDNEASELYEAEEVLGVVFPTDEDATLPLNPGKEALHEPASHIPA